jgi:hypothetical protein
VAHVGAAEGCDLLILKNKIKRSQPSAAPTGDFSSFSSFGSFSGFSGFRSFRAANASKGPSVRAIFTSIEFFTGATPLLL